jgi:guanylate kinase
MKSKTQKIEGVREPQRVIVNKQETGKGKIVIISGPSGVGKSTICKEVAKRLDNVCLSVSVTTRPRAKTEVNGQDYWFVSPQQFRKRIDEGSLLEYAEVFGHLYGTPKDKVEEALAAGKTIILEIDVQGAKQVKSLHPDAAMVFIFPPTARELAERIKSRGREGMEAAEKRLEGAGAEFAAAWQYYKYMVINDDLEQAVKEVIQIIEQIGVASTGSPQGEKQ